MTATTHVILVDPNDQPMGEIEKIAAHRLGLRHRAFSIFVFRQHPRDWELLLQQRANHKYHTPGLWTNTCCSHPKPTEGRIEEAAARRLQEEMGFQTPLSYAGWFHYIAAVGNGLTENENDHVFTGILMNPTVIKPNAAEAQAYRWISLTDLNHELHDQPENFTPWFAKAYQLALKNIPTT